MTRLLSRALLSAAFLLQSVGCAPQNYALLATENIAVGLGDTSSSFAVSDQGDARYQIPLWVSPGRAGVEPVLALTYGSSGGNGPLGVGWNLAGGSSISRCRRTLARDGLNAAVSFSAADAFCLDGAHLIRIGQVAGGTAIEFRPEQNPATRVLMHSDAQGPLFFEVYTRDGRISSYGKASPSGAPANNALLQGQRVAIAPAGGATDNVTTTHSTVRLTWALSDTRDRAGNNMRWIYKITSEVGASGETHYEQLPTEISYTGFVGTAAQSAAAPALRKVTLAYEPRTDREFRFLAGFGLKTSERLLELAMSGPSIGDASYSALTNISVLRRYTLKYENFSITGRSLLTNVQECDGSGVCRVPIEFQWELGCGIGTATYPERIGTGCSRASDPNPSPFEDLDLGLEDVMKFSNDSIVWQNLPQIADLWTLQTSDVDGDGRDDLLYRVPVLNASQSALVKTNWVYRLSTGRGFGPPVTTTLPESLTGASIEDLRTVDIDADGRTDVISVQNANLSTGQNGSYDAFTFNGTQYQSAGISGQETFQGWWSAATPALFPAMHVADLDGDGRPELVRSAVNVTPFSPPPPTGSPFRWAFRSNASTSGIQLGTYTTLGVTSGIDHASYVVDWNNDGAVDFLARDAGGPSAGDGFLPHYSAISLDAAGQVVKTPIALSGLPLELSVQLTSYGAPSWPSYHYFRPWFLDVNGDGLPDAVAFREHQKVEFPSTGVLSTIAGAPYVAINTGNGFKPYQKYFIGTLGEVSPIYDRVSARMVDPGVRPIDYNGDGRTDLLITDRGVGLSIKRQTFVVLQARFTGSGFDTIGVPIPIGDSTMLAGKGGAQDRGRGQRMTQLLDANGDGLTDVVQVVNGRVHLYLRKGKKPDMLIRMNTRPQTPAVQITYGPIGDSPTTYTPGTCAYPLRCVTRGLWTVTRHTVENGLGGLNAWKYAYADGRLDLKGHGWLGFGKTVVTDEQLGATHTTTRDNATFVKPDPAVAAYIYPFASKLATDTNEVRVDGTPAAPLHRRTIAVNYQTKLDPTGKVLFAFPQTTTSTESEGTAPAFVAHKVVMDVDGFGNPTSSTQSAGATLTSPPPLDRHSSVTTYKNDTTAWLVGLPETITVTSTTAAGKSSSRDWTYTYDPTTGLTATVEAAPSHQTDPITPTSSDVNRFTQYTRDAYGLVESVMQSGSAVAIFENITYDTLDHTFPLKRTNAANHEETLYYHSGLGVVAAQDDHHGVRTLLHYDGFGRLRKIDLPSLSDISISYTSGYGSGNAPGQAVVRDIAQSSTPWRDPREVIVYDRLGRPSRMRHTSYNGGQSIVDLVYDRLGRLERKSMPYLSSGTGTAGYISYTYDNLGRLRTSTNPGSPARRHEYENLITRVLDEEGNVRSTEHDVLGRLVRTTDVKPAGAPITTRFEYGPFNTVEAIVDPLNHRTTIEHDPIGRQIKRTHPDAGVEEWAYDAFDQIKRMVNGAGDVTTFRYDSIGRTYSTTNAGGTSLYIWDTAAFGVGKLAQTQGADGVDTVYSYNPQGRLSLALTNAQGQSLTVRRDYDAYGRLEVLTPPGPLGSAVKYVYNDTGFLKEIRGAATNGPLYWRADARNASNQITAETFGSGLKTARTYDAQNRVKFIETTSAFAKIQELAYDYDPGRGLVRSRHDRLAQTTEDFEYDSLARLNKWTVFQNCEESVLTFGYDDDGNLMNRTLVKGTGASVVNTYTGGVGGPHAIRTSTSGAQSAGFTYDGGGRQKTGPNRTVDYTWFNLPSRVVNGPRTTTLKYDAFQNRTVKQASNGDTTIYAGGVYEQRKTAAGVRHLVTVMGPDRPVALISTNVVNGAIANREVQYLHDDRLGSIDTISGSAGALSERMKFDPFGSRRDPARLAAPAPVAYGVPHIGFTEHEADDDFGLTNMRGRMYDQVAGRFLTPDPLVPAPQRGQSYNAYSYVVNNPLAFTDPSGFLTEIEQNYSPPSLINFDLHDLVMWLIHQIGSGDGGKAQTSGQADKNGSAPDTPDLRPPGPHQTTEAEWMAREDPLQNLSEDQRDTEEWHQFDKRVTRDYIDPVVKVLAVGVRVLSVAGGPELFMAANAGMDGVDDQEGWNTGLGTEGRIVRGVVGVAWGGLGALTRESRVATQYATGIDDVVQGQKMVDDVVDLHFGGVKFTHKPTFNPNLPPGVFGESQTAKVVGGPYLQIGPQALVNERELLETLLHEEMHFRRWSAGIPTTGHHSPYFDAVIQRFFRMKGWIRPPTP